MNNGCRDWEARRKMARGAQRALVLVLLVLVFCGARANADTVADLTEQYAVAGAASQLTRPAGFHGLIGAGLFNGERITGEPQRRTILLPIVIMTYEDWAYWSIGGGGLWLLQDQDHSMKLGIGVKVHPGYRPDDDPDLAGIERRNASLDGSVNGLWRTPLVTVGISYYHDILDVYDGDSASLRFSHPFRLSSEFSLAPDVGISWDSARIVDYYYGVRPAEATAVRPAYRGRESINIGGGLAGSYRISPSWSLLGGVRVTRFGYGISDSPIVPHRSSAVAYFGGGWRF